MPAFLAALAALCLLSLSCDLPLADAGGNHASGVTGGLNLSFSDSQASSGGSRTILPTSAEITVQSYVLTASGPNGRTLGPLVASTTSGHSFSNLAVGTWTFNATGHNGLDGAGAAVTAGSVVVEIVPDETSQATINMGIQTGAGDYSFIVEWPTLGIVTIDYNLTYPGGFPSVSPLPTRTDGSSKVTLSGTGLNTGMYGFWVGATYEGVTVNVCESLQVYNGFTSTKTIALAAADFTSPPPAPTALGAAALNRRVVLSWTDNSYTENSFILERNVDSGGWGLLSDAIPANSTSYTDADVDFSHTYSYRIKASNGIGDSECSNECAFDPVNVTGVTIADADFYLPVGKTKPLSVSVLPANAFDGRVIWSSDNVSVAEVDAQSGLVTAKWMGAATITATAQDNLGGVKTDGCIVTVCPDPDITAFSFISALNSGAGIYRDCFGFIGAGIHVTVPYGTNLSNLIPIFASTGDTTWYKPSPEGAFCLVESGTTAIDFSSTPLEFMAVALSGHEKHIMVHVTVAPESGSIWSERAMSGTASGLVIRSVASSYDGGTLVVAEQGTGYLHSTADGGLTWKKLESAGRRDWWSVASSSDGIILVASANNGYVYTSGNSGATWTEHAVLGKIEQLPCIACSATGQYVLVANMKDKSLVTSSDAGATWASRKSGSSFVWQSVAVNGNGAVMLAADSAASTGGIYRSTDYGATWSSCSTLQNIYYVTTDGTGTRFAAAQQSNGYVYISNDGGSTWEAQTGIPNGNSGLGGWRGLAMSADGTRLVASCNGSYVYTAVYGGGTWTWTKQTGSEIKSSWFQGAAISSDGSRMVCVAENGFPIISADGGATWTERTNLDSMNWNAVAGTPDGSVLYAAPVNSHLRKSTDGGATWMEFAAAGRKNWKSIACSEDGTKLIAGTGTVAYPEYIYISADGGENWTKQTAPGTAGWVSVAISGNGLVMAAVSYNNYVWVSVDGGASWASQTSASARDWRQVWVSPDGLKILAPAYSAKPWLGTYSVGTSTWTWTELSTTSKAWTGAVSTPDGTKFAACVSNGSIWIFSGGTWVDVAASLGPQFWNGIAMSSDGTRLVAITNDGAATAPHGSVYISSDGGNTWKESSAGRRYWKSLYSSRDGSLIIAGAENCPSLFFSGRDFNDITLTVE